MSGVPGPGAARFVGARVPRAEDRRLLTGRGRFVDDVALPGALHVAFVRSPFARAEVRGVDRGPAAAAPGVRAVLTLADLGGPPGRGAPPLADTDVRYVGDPVVMVLAESRALAEDAAALVDVDYEPLPAVVGVDAALRDEVIVDRASASNVLRPPGDVTAAEAALARCAHVFDETLRQHRYVASPMEPRGVVARWDAALGELTVWVSNQGAHACREDIIRATGIEGRRVRVVTGDVGGAFGQKIGLGREEIAVVRAALATGQALRWIEDRWENLVAASHSREEQARIRVGTDGEGRIEAIVVEHVDDVGAYGSGGMGVMSMAFTGGYRVPEGVFSSRSCRTNTMSRAAYRGPWMFETVLREVMIDVVARGLGLDPLEIRRRNVLQAADLPFRTPMGSVLTEITPAETLEQAVAMLDYDAFRREQAAARAEGRYLGVGISLFVEPNSFGAGLPGTEATIVRIEPDGKVQVVTSASSQGHSVETTLAQIVADQLGVEVEDVVVSLGDTASAPVGSATGGSRNAVIAGGAARDAAGQLRSRLLAIGAHALEAAIDDLDLEHGSVTVRGTPAATMTVGQLARLAYNRPDQLPPGIPPGLEVMTRWRTDAGITFSNACHICTCEVDVATGKVRLLRFVVSEDCGVMINPNVVEGQIAGGVVQGIGGALLEHLVYDRAGNPLTTTFLDYLLPTAAETPAIEYGHVETPSSRPGGSKGMGEGGAIGAPAAVVNAIADALAPLGARVLDQPLGPAQVRALIEEAAAG
jgi:carbon-monoxide dehydrogenase large subunit